MSIKLSLSMPDGARDIQIHPKVFAKNFGNACFLIVSAPKPYKSKNRNLHRHCLRNRTTNRVHHAHRCIGATVMKGLRLSGLKYTKLAISPILPSLLLSLLNKSFYYYIFL